MTTRNRRWPASARLLLALALAAATACGRADARGASGDGEASSGEEPRAAPAEVVRNGTVGAWKAGEAWRAREDLRLGSADGGEDAFGRVAAVEVDPLGRVWVADAQANQIRVFDAAGKHVRTVGRKGGGPGEFQQIAGMAWAPNGRLWVVDPGNARFSVFDTAGALVTTHARPRTAAQSPWGGGFDGQGRLHDAVLLPLGPAEQVQAVVRYDAEFRRADTLLLPRFQPQVFEVGSGASRSRINVPFTGAQVWALDPSGDLWVGVTDRYRFERLDGSGRAVRGMEKEFSPVPVSAAELDYVLAAYRPFEQMGGTIDRSRIPRSKPPVFGIFSSPDGKLWVSPARPRGEPAAYDVFDGGGRFLGSVPLPRPLAIHPLPVVRGDAVYGVSRDADGVESVVRLRIEKPR